MPTVDYPAFKSLIAKLTQYAKSKIPSEAQYALFCDFLRLFYSHTSESDLKHRPLEELFGMAYSHWLMIAKRSCETAHCIRIFNPEIEKEGWHSTHTIVEIMMKDMPFIVDSARIAMNRLGFTVHLMIYMGGMKITRNAEGEVTAVAPFNALEKSQDDIESPVYIEIDRQTDPVILKTVEDTLNHTLSDVEAAVSDWLPMQVKVQEAIDELLKTKARLPKEEVQESVAFLQWLLDGQFTFLGVRDYEVVGEGETLALRLVKNTGLGVLRDEAHSKVNRLFSEIPEAARALMLSTKELLVISKTNTLSTVHRQVYTDYIGIKRFNDVGKLVGERRIIGLYTSTAYSSHPKQIPFLRHKVASLLEKSGLPPRSHAGKDLMHILETFPRDDLFQTTIDDLYNITMGILSLQDRRKLRLFVREDAYGRYVSCFVYVPRENFNAQLISRIQDVLMKAFNGLEASYSTYFYTPELTRIYYNIRLESKKKLRYDLEELQTRLLEVSRTWQDGLREALHVHYGEERGNQVFSEYRDAFSAGYCANFTAHHAVVDIEHIQKIPDENTLGMSLYCSTSAESRDVKFKLYRRDKTVPLSDALPILENLGLRVIGEEPYQVTFKKGKQVWINDFAVEFSRGASVDISAVRTIFQDAFHHIWSAQAENDLFNTLVLGAELTWREVAILRAYTKYLRQTGFTYSVDYVAETFAKYANIAKLFVRLFHRLFDPALQDQVGENSPDTIEKLLQQQINQVALLDEDRIFQRIFAAMKATLRTNFYQDNKRCMAFKLSPNKIPEMPLPLPMFEIFVYSPRFEGVHLRSSQVARGGLRWSDRKEDFRTEVLGLMKAQQVKNAVIVPSGAKGGFVPKNLPVNGTREEIMQEGITCYQLFIQSLLDVTDNRIGTEIVSPKNTVCYDDVDPYLVVAADKGTATFSDIANTIAIENNFWLGDAFASGGSAGYDHKKMGITARGAWVSAERHFQGLNIDVDATEITVVGIGDLSGDVFGNGVLLSKHLKLVAAFNHMHIFLDPNPDTEKSFEERERMFALPRSTWADYQTDLISVGGGIHLRSAKSIEITPEVKAVLGIEADRLAPTDLIHAILKAPVDMIWNGGIGTYVKASVETHVAVGDRANDGLRVNANQLRTRVFVEGGNLGCTQLGRIEFALNGGLINTDFIDNSAGVDCSDHEVNIKILLGAIVSSGDLTLKQRNILLASMTEEVSNLVLQNNYHQNEAVSLLATLSPKEMGLYENYLDTQEQLGKINRELEYLPDAKTLQERRANNLGLTRPEISILLSYSKIILKDAIRHSDLLQDPALAHYIKNAFPSVLYKKYPEAILNHRLRDEILATQLSNYVVSHMGITFVHRMQDETGADTASIVRAFIVASTIFNVKAIYTDIEELDYQVDVALQYQMFDEVMRLVRRATRWLLLNWREPMNVRTMIGHFEIHIKTLYKKLPKLLLGSDKEGFESRRAQLIEAGVPEEISTRIASARSMYHALNIILAADTSQMDVYQAAQIYFTLVDRLELHCFRDRINDHPVTHRWSVLAKATFKADLDRIQRKLTTSVIEANTTSTKNIHQRVNVWLETHANALKRWRAILTDLRSDNVLDFSIISVGMRELFDVIQETKQ
ncbi:MAG: NAD-glutamate dehydrogenase [Coxiellaceae bacterium]|nr:NAD-glutamate dehydrogenase [Coxiellaceae bacterium]